MRATSGMLGTQGMYDPLRREGAGRAEILSHIARSVTDRANHRPRQLHRTIRWEDAILMKGYDPDWRPSGDAYTLYKEGREYGLREIHEWVAQAARDYCSVLEGICPAPVKDLRQVSSEWLRPEADALKPWWIEGEYFDHPIPMARLFTTARRRDGAVDPGYFQMRRDQGDVDQDICHQISTYGVDVGSGIEDTLLAGNLKAFSSSPETCKAATDCIESETATGAFLPFHSVPCLPMRVPPRFVVDEGVRPDGQRKLRSVVHHSYPNPREGVHRFPEGTTNSTTSPPIEEEKIRMGSGRAFFESVGILTQSEVEVAISKRDGKNAFRQVDIAPLDYWMTAAVTADATIYRDTGRVEPIINLDGAIGMGGSLMMYQFQRAVDVANRDVNERCALLDADHPPSVTSVCEYRKQSIASVGKAKGGRLDTNEQYADDSLRAGCNDIIKLAYEIIGPKHTTSGTARWSERDMQVLRAGTEMGREEAKLLIFDRIFEIDMKMEMAGGSKRLTIVSTKPEWLEALGVEGCPQKGVMRYPAAKQSKLLALITNAVGGPTSEAETASSGIARRHAPTARLNREAVHTLVSKEKWMAHVAMETNPLLASAWALVRAQGRPTFVTPSAKFIADQRAIRDILESGTTVPMNPRLTFPALYDPLSVIAAQDASTSWGAGGWLLYHGMLHAWRIRWPEWLHLAIHEVPKRWSISPGELWAMWMSGVVLRRATIQRGLFVTIFTDNESARAAATRGTSNSPQMRVIAEGIALWAAEEGITMRAMRVTTKENQSADDISREGGEAAAQALADHLGVPLTMHEIDGDAEETWALVRLADISPAAVAPSGLDLNGSDSE